MPSVLVTGANRGLGLEFVRQYADSGWRVYACCRKPEQAQALNELAAGTQAVSVHPLDVADHHQIDALGRTLGSEPLDVLLNNAGTYGGHEQQNLGNLDYESWAHTFQVNTMGPVRMVERLLDNLERSQRRLVVTITSLMGSIADNTSGGSYLYRTSKAALNAAMKSVALDVAPRGVHVLLLHPGWVRTDMGGPNALITPQESVRTIRQRVEMFTPDQSGDFLNYDGHEYPW
ncbi:MAG: SDR family oxidoreductase [Gammaproteobacteria bacterium]|jgi:NAD(P)-dependent dehydrogenase (short-subunit alcohol dehydrogenase family)